METKVNVHLVYNTRNGRNSVTAEVQIAQVKREYGADMQSSRKKDDARHPNIPKEKRDALVEALYHFRIIEKA